MKNPLGILLLLLFASGCSTPSTHRSSADVYVPPKAVQMVQPKYPFELHKQGTTGHAVVEFIVTKSGDVVQARAVSATHPLFGAAAVEAVLKSKFTPPLKNGMPVNSRMQLPVSFDLEEEKKPNQPSEPTAPSVTPRAEPRVAPASAAAHL